MAGLRAGQTGNFEQVAGARNPELGHLDRIRLVASRANRQPALAAHLPGADGSYRADGVMVLVVAEDGIQAITGFQDASLFQPFGPALDPAAR